MAATFPGTDKVAIDVTFNTGGVGINTSARIQASAAGASAAIIPDFTMVYGTGTVLDANGAVPVNSLYFFQGTIANGTTKSIDLIGGADLDVFGVAMNLTKVKWFCVANIGTAAGAVPDGINKLYVGPQGVANAFSTPWGGAGATVYEECYWSKQCRGPATGWVVTASTADLFQVKNPGGTDLTVLIAIAGKI